MRVLYPSQLQPTYRQPFLLSVLSALMKSAPTDSWLDLFYTPPSSDRRLPLALGAWRTAPLALCSLLPLPLPPHLFPPFFNSLHPLLTR